MIQLKSCLKMQKETNTEQAITLVGLTVYTPEGLELKTLVFPLQSSYSMRKPLQDAENSTYKIDLLCCLEELFCIISDVNKNIQLPLTQLKLGRDSLPTLSSSLFEGL